LKEGWWQYTRRVKRFGPAIDAAFGIIGHEGYKKCKILKAL